MYFLTHARSGGNWTFNGQLTGLGLADFLLGRVGRLEHGGPGVLPMDQWYSGLYAQDTWRATSRVTHQRGPALGAVLRPERPERRHLQLQPRQLPEQRQEHRVRERAGRSHLSGRRGLPARQDGPEHAVVEPLAARGRGVGRERRRPHGGARRRTGSTYDFPTAEYHYINAQSPPFGNRSARRRSSGRLRRSRTRTSAAIRIRSSRAADTQFIPVRRVRRDRPRHQLAARPVSGT